MANTIQNAQTLSVDELKQGLFYKSLVPQLFWNRYQALTATIEREIQSDEMLFQLQIQHLQTLENKSPSLSQYGMANDFIQNAQGHIMDLNNNLVQQTSSQLYAGIIDAINTGLTSNKMSPVHLENIEQKNARIATICKDVEQLLRQINIDTQKEGGFGRELLDKLQSRLTEMTLLDQNSGTYSQDRYNNKTYVNIKADWGEKIGRDLIDTNPAFKSLQTGAIVDATNQQLIEDIMTFNKQALSKQLVNPFSNGIDFHIDVIIDNKNNYSKKINTLQDLFNEVDMLGNQKYSITISDDLYSALKAASIFNTQVKTGMQQNILTNAQRNAVSLEDVGLGNHGLWQLMQYQQTHPEAKYYKKAQKSTTLSALTNYYLSKSIGLTALSRNQVYFTKFGIQTASQWMTAAHRMLKFKPNITKVDLNLKTPRRYTLVAPRTLSDNKE